MDWNKSLDSIRQEKFVSQDRRRYDRIAVKKERMTVDDRRTRQKTAQMQEDSKGRQERDFRTGGPEDRTGG